MAASEAAELRAAAAEKAALLGAAEERLARLEALHRIAQVTRAKILMPACPCSTPDIVETILASHNKNKSP